MKYLKIILLIGLFFINSAYAQKENSTIKAGKVYKQTGAKIFSPNETGWQIVKADSLETVFEKNTSEAKFAAFAKIKTIADYQSVEDLFKNLEEMKQSELDMPNRDSLHFNRTNYKEAPCLQYDGIFNNDATKIPKYKYFNFSGNLCRHPKDKTVVIQIEFYVHSNSRGFSEAEIKLIKDFLGKVEFSKVASK